MISVFGAALAVSFGVFCTSKGFKTVYADELVDLGTITFTDVNSDSTKNNIYGVTSAVNDLPSGWETTAFTPMDDESGTFINNTRKGAEIKKLREGTYYIAVAASVTVDTYVTVKGNWSNGTAKFTVEEFTRRWNGSRWVEDFIIPDLEPYDKVSLTETGFDDVDRQSFTNTVLAPNEWNTFAPSASNTRNSFAVEFGFQSYGNMTATLTIKVGNSGIYDEGHRYELALNNTWGSSGGVMFLAEYVNTEQIYRTSDLGCLLRPGKKHIIEFGSIYVLDSNDTYNYVMYDGEYLYQEVRTPGSHERTTKVAYNYGGNNISISSTTTQKENTQILKFNHLGENKKGMYFDGTINAIPANWENKGAPASKYNALINGEPMYEYGVGHPMSKCSDEEDSSYYLDLELSGHAFKEGDVITLSDEFHFYYDSKAYTMSVIPVSVLYSNNQFVEISDIYAYLTDKIDTHCDPSYYDEDKLEEIAQIVADGKTAISSATTMKGLWDVYLDYIAQLDAIPYSEEKAREILNNAKTEAKLELNALVDESIYDETNLEIVRGYVTDAISEIEKESTDTVAKVEEIVNTTMDSISKVKTKLQAIEEKIMDSDELLTEYLATYDVVTTTDLCAVGDLVFHETTEDSYSSGGYDDITTRLATSTENKKGNMIFQFTYVSDAPTERKSDKYGAQIFIRMRGTDDSTSYRFDIACEADGNKAGVAIATLVKDVAVDRIIFNADLQPDTEYKIECGTIDLEGYARTLLFLNINGNTVLKTIVDSLDETEPTIRIMDSFVKDPHYAKMSAIEEGTTKGDKSSLLGRLVLDNSSNKDSLLATLRNNNLDISSTLYPLEKGAFKVNGEEIPNKRSATRIQKISDVKYIIQVDNYEFNNGDTITIGGLFGAFASTELVKSVYKLFNTTFTYNAVDDSWSQEAPTDPTVIIYEAKETIKNYLDKANYSSEHVIEIDSIIDSYLALVDDADISEIPSVVENALKALDDIPTLFDEYKENAKQELREYRLPAIYRDEEKAELDKILNEAFAKIDNCSDEDSVDLVVIETKAEIDELKTAEQRDAEDLLEAKKAARLEIDEFLSRVQVKRYSDENVVVLTNLYYSALDDIDAATSIEEVNAIVAGYKEAVKNVKTKDGSTFDGEKYIEKKSSGCGGSIETVSMLSFVAIFGAAVLLVIKKIKEN